MGSKQRSSDCTIEFLFEACGKVFEMDVVEKIDLMKMMKNNRKARCRLLQTTQEGFNAVLS